jgi:D-alanyl-D-alanine dipeptidase
MTQQYVSVPSTDETRPSPHNTGGSVDLAIVRLTLEQEEELNRLQSQLSEHDLTTSRRAALEMRKSALIRHHASMLSFGTPFDHGGEKAGLAYYEQELAKGTTLSEDDVEACGNRRLLYNVMTRAGFQSYFAEWWHFNAPESQMGAATAGFDYATFGTAPFSEDNVAHESLRTRIYTEAVQLQERLMSCVGKVSTQSALASAILETLPTTGEPRLAFSWPTEIIAPAER